MWTGAINLDGSEEVARRFPDWLGLSPLARIERPMIGTRS